MRRHELPREVDPVLLLADCVTLFLLLAGGFAAFLTAYEIEISLWPLTVACGIAAVVSAILWHCRRGGWLALLAAGLWAFLSWSYRKEIGLVLGYLDDRVHGIRTDPSLEFFLRKVEAGRSLLPVLILFVLVGLALLMGWLTVRGRCWYLTALIELIPLVPAFLSGSLPNWLALLAGMTGWGTLLLTALFVPRDHRSLGRATLLSQAGLAGLLAALTFALPMEGYQRPQWATDARQELFTAVAQRLSAFPATEEQWNETLSHWAARLGLRLSGGGTGEMSGNLDLRTVGPRLASENLVMTVSTDEAAPAGRVYLRGAASGVYNGLGWAAVSEDGEFAEVVYYPAASAVETPRAAMTIRPASPSGRTAYYPYRLAALPESGVTLAGSGALEKTPGLEKYQVSYVPGGPDSGFVPLSASRTETAYRQFAVRTYTQVPEGARLTLEPLLGVLEDQEAEWPDAFPQPHQAAVAAARRTAALLSSLAVYDQNAPAMEDGEDFVSHFLEEGRGYCVHFATLGALLLRLEGVPARFVRGYVADLDAGGQASVRDSAAHAWVEIYLDGYGWYPVEMTPGFREAAAAGGEVDAVLPQEETAPDRQRPNRELPEMPLPDEPQDAADTALEQNQEPQESPGGGDAGGAPLDLSWLWRAAAALLVLAALFGGYRAALLWRSRRREQPDTNRSVIAAYRRYRRLLPWRCEEDPALEELARKAKFSQHTLTGEERAAAWNRLDVLYARTAGGAPWWKQWCLRLLKPLF